AAASASRRAKVRRESFMSHHSRAGGGGPSSGIHYWYTETPQGGPAGARHPLVRGPRARVRGAGVEAARGTPAQLPRSPYCQMTRASLSAALPQLVSTAACAALASP